MGHRVDVGKRHLQAEFLEPAEHPVVEFLLRFAWMHATLELDLVNLVD